MVNSHKDLFIWQRSMDLVESIYRLTASLPASEQFGLIAQMRRSAVSVPSNIAEGYGRQATGEYRHHLLICRGSLLELETQLLLCRRLKYSSEQEIDPLLTVITEISKMLGSLIAKLS
ncbi:MAG: four helix bundle protein [Deltaproteobacteria bacterium]|nr:MAG: four helix bundle protein [Deltaproteobacteria bacterium]